MIWRGSAAFTIGEADEFGNPIRTFTVVPGEEIPNEWVEILRQGMKQPGGILEVDDGGKFSPDKVKAQLQKD